MFISRSQLDKYYKDSSKLDADLKLIGDSSLEDDLLFEWLTQDDEVWPALCPVFERRVLTRKGFEAWLLEADRLRHRLTLDLKRIGAYFVIIELREFAGHTIWNRFGKIPHYEDIIKNVHDRVSLKYGVPKREDMSVADRELSLSAIVLQEGLERLSPDKVNEILKDSNLGSASDFEELRSGILRKLSSKSSSGFKSMVSSSIAKKVGSRLLGSALGKSQVANAGKLGNMASKVLPIAFRRIGLYVSVGFLMKDAYDMGGEATRVTNPAVVIISLYRSFGGK